MDVRFMLRIRARAEHRCEAMAGAVADLVAEFLRNRNVGQSHRAAVRQYKCTHIGGVAFAVLAQLRTGNTVATATLKVVKGLDRTQWRAELVDAWRRFIAQPGSDGFGKLAAEHRRRLDFDARTISAQYRRKPQHVPAAASIRSDQARQRLGDSDCQNDLVALRRFAGDACRVEIGAGGLAEGLRLDPDWRTRAWQRHYLGDGDATAGTGQPQERKPKPHTMDVRRD